MKGVKEMLEALDETISDLEDKVIMDIVSRRETQKKQTEFLKVSRAREANVLATAQKVASRLDQTIQHVENIVRH